MKKNKVKKALLINKYNCLLRANKFSKSKKNIYTNLIYSKLGYNYSMLNYSKDYLYNIFILEILIKRLVKDGKVYKIRKKLLKGCKLFKKISKKDPLLFYIFILNYYMISVGFVIKVKSGRPFTVPANIWHSEEEEYSATIKLFKKTLKMKSRRDLSLKMFFELLSLNSYPKKSNFYSVVLENYYDKIIDNYQNIGMK